MRILHFQRENELIRIVYEFFFKSAVGICNAFLNKKNIGFRIGSFEMLTTRGDQWTTPSWSNTIYENYKEEKSGNDDNDDGRGKVSSWWTTSMNLLANAYWFAFKDKQLSSGRCMKTNSSFSIFIRVAYFEQMSS